MNNMMAKLGMKYLAGKMDGKKTYFGGGGKILIGVGSIISGVVGIIGNMFPDQGLPSLEYEPAIALIGAGWFGICDGLSTVGIGHKIQKSESK